MPKYQTGTIERVPRKYKGKMVDGLITGDDGTPFKFRWPKDWKETHGMRGMQVRFVGTRGRAMGMKRSLATTRKRY